MAMMTGTANERFAVLYSVCEHAVWSLCFCQLFTSNECVGSDVATNLLTCGLQKQNCLISIFLGITNTWENTCF